MAEPDADLEVERRPLPCTFTCRMSSGVPASRGSGPYGDRVGGVEDAWGNSWYILRTLGSAVPRLQGQAKACPTVTTGIEQAAALHTPKKFNCKLAIHSHFFKVNTLRINLLITKD